jgi:crotonobetainyl-CoA:carnitine CoA-transferase CaiB-like acyl-CoA transferase
VSAPSLPLAGIRVLDLATLYAAPLIATNLGDFGADVIKVEHPRGDEARGWGLKRDGVPLWWKTLSRNKRLVAADLHDPAGRDRVLDLAAAADVMIENFRPGRLEEFGLGYDMLAARNPRLVLVRVSGFGQTGPRRLQPGFGTLAEAFSGFAHITGEAGGPPTLPPFGLADGIAAQVGTYAVMMALYWRDAQGGGLGQVIDLSLYEPIFSVLGPQLTEYAALGAVQGRMGNRSPRTSPRNAYRTSDGRWVAISGGTQQVADRILAAIGRPELAADSRFANVEGRRANGDELDQLIAVWIGARPLAEVLVRFDAAEAPVAPVYSSDQIFEDPQYRARESFVELPDPDLGRVTMAAVVPRLSRTPGRVAHPARTPIDADAGAAFNGEVTD